MAAAGQNVKEAYQKFFEKNNWAFNEKNFDPWDWTEVMYDVQEGYEQQQELIKNYLRAGAGILLVTGTPGWGKTNTVRHVAKQLEPEGFVSVYFDVPPPTERDFVEQIGIELLRRGIIRKPLLSFLKPPEEYVGTLGIFNLKRRIAEAKNNKTVVLICDEAHSGDPKTNLNWFKVVNDDKATNSKLILIGYESERVSLREAMEKTFTDRAFEQVALNGLARDEIGGMLKKRLHYKCGKDASLKPLSDVLDYVTLKCGGRPRFALKVMSRLWRHMAANGIDRASPQDVKSIMETVEGEERSKAAGQQQLTEVADMVATGPPDFSVLSDFMSTLCKAVAEQPGQTAEELAAKLNSDKHVVWSNIARLMLKDSKYRNRFIRSNLTEPVIVVRSQKAGGRRRKTYYIAERYKGEFVKT